MRRPATANITALALHDALAAARNPVMLMMLASCVLLTMVFGEIVDVEWLGTEGRRAFLATVVATIAPAFIGSVGTLYVMSEEFEKGVPATLVQAGATTAQMAVGKTLSALAWTSVAALACCLAAGFSAAFTAATVALAVFAALPVQLTSLGLGLLSDDQMRCSAYSIPIIVVALVPLFSLLSEGFRPLARFLPMGYVAEAASAAAGAPSLLPGPAVAALFFAWLAVSAVFAVWAHRTYARRIAAVVDRRA